LGGPQLEARERGREGAKGGGVELIKINKGEEKVRDKWGGGRRGKPPTSE